MAENTRDEHRSYILTTFLFIAAATGICWLFRFLRLPETNIVVVYILSVLLTARFTRGYTYGIAASPLES